MIEKLEPLQGLDHSWLNKINEIIDILNAIVVETKDGTFIDGSKKAEPVDPYAEQRKWIGKLCWCWDTEREDAFCYVLGRIDEYSEYPYVRKGFTEAGYKHCEPVSEDLIYNCDKTFDMIGTEELWRELIRTRKALDKGMEHITGLNNMIESWYKLINSDEDKNAKLLILKSAISAYVENKGGNNE